MTEPLPLVLALVVFLPPVLPPPLPVPLCCWCLWCTAIASPAFLLPLALLLRCEVSQFN